ncbi:hypothetical protein ACFL5X_01665 [Candidatus Omnitrophota bacterium]
MSRTIAILLLAVFLLSTGVCFGQPLARPREEKILVVREGKQLKKTTVTVEGYLVDDILDVTVGVRMPSDRAKINKFYLTGPGLGKIHYAARTVVPPSVDDVDEEPFPVTKVDGMIMFGDRTREKTPKGRLTKESFQLKVPIDKIKPGKRYELVVDVESQEKAQRIPKFKFHLQGFAELIANNS